MAKSTKRVRSGHPTIQKWEQALLAAAFDEDKWKSNITFLVGNQPEDYVHIKALSASVASGIRKLFSVISQEELYKEVNEIGNPKLKKSKDVPPHYEVCEACKLYLDLNEDIPLTLQARLIKYKLLSIKAADLKRRDAEKKLLEQNAQKRQASVDKDKVTKGKDKKDARSKSPGKKGGRKTPETQTVKEGSKLKKRGEEDDSNKYIDDEPDDGAQHYILIYGFNNPNLFAQLADININVDAIIKVFSQDYNIFNTQEAEAQAVEKDEKTLALEEAAKEEKRALSKELKKFWKDVILLLQRNADTSKLHDIAQLEYEVKSLIIPSNMEDPEQKLNFGKTLFEDIAVMIYDLIDARRLYRTYLENLKLYHVPLIESPVGQGTATPQTAPNNVPPADDTPQVDMRYYNDLMNTIPQESVSVSLVLYCMLEQISATDENRDPPSEIPPPLRTDGLNNELATHLGNVAFKLALTDEEHKILSNVFDLPELPQDSPNQPLIINHHDDVTVRTHHLQPTYGFNAMDVEKDMLKRLPFASLCDLPRPTSVVARERAARLQELIHFCATETLSKSEIDRAFKQFVFESMDLKVTDPNGFIMTLEGEGLEHSAIPWDDPYPFFKGMIPKQDKSLSPHIPTYSYQSVDHSSGASLSPLEKNQSLDLSKTPSEQSRPSTSESKKGILRSSSRSESPIIKHSRSNSVHFEVEDVGSSTRQETVDEEEEITSKESEDDERTLEDSMMEIVESQKRVLDQWCFAEHFEPHIMLQILKEATYHLLFMDTYYHKRDHTLLVCLHNPHNSELQNHIGWHCEVHSNLGFRNYLEYVADSIADWLKEKEAEYQARLLQIEVDKFKKDEELVAKAAEKAGKGRKQSSAKSRSRSPKGSRSSSRERDRMSPGTPFIRAGSLKAWKMEQDMIKAEEEEKERQKAEKRVKSPKKKEDEKDDKEKDRKRPSSRNSSRKGSQKGQSESVELPLGDEKFWKFYGYDVGNSLIHASGTLTTLLPSDGGQIRVERTEFVQATTYVKSSILKDGHVFSIHIVNPKEDFDEDNDSEILDTEDQREKAEFEKSEKDENEVIDENTKSVQSETEEKPIKVPAVSAFGSIIANLTDGMILSFSHFGPKGETEEGKRYEPEPYVPPLTIQSPAPPPQSPTKPKKEKDKGKGLMTPDPPEIVEEDTPDDEKAEEENVPEQPFQQLFVSCPDGLNVRYYLESSVGVKPNSPEDRRIVVKQSYPFKTRFTQPCEASRKKIALSENSRLITSDGTVIKDMVDGSVEVLYADGTITTHTGAWPISTSRSTTPQRITSSRSNEERITPSKKGKGAKANTNKQSVEKNETSPTEENDKGTWTTTYPNGERRQVFSDGTVKELEQVMICVASDPETRQSMSTRDDHVITVSYPDGTTVVEHSDGTRITTYYRENQIPVDTDEIDESGEIPHFMRNLVKFIKIECPGTATVEFNCSTSENLTLFGTGTSINVFPDGFYVVQHCEGGRIEIDTEGTFVYFPRPIRNMEKILPAKELQYILRHNSETICELVDPEGNEFNIKYNGDVFINMHDGDEMISEESLDDFKHEKTVSQYMQHAPRFFIIHADGSGTELLRYQDIAEYLMTAEQSQSTAVLKDLLPDYPGVTGITILKPYTGGPSERWLRKYDLESIIPRGIQRRDLTTLPPKEIKIPGPEFGTNVGKGLAIGSLVTKQERFPIVKCPSILELRQFVQYKPVTAGLRATLRSGLREYAEYVMTRNRAAEMMQCTDPRTEEEKLIAADLQNIMSPKQGDSLQFVPADIKEIYEAATAPPYPSPPPTPTAKRGRADWERDQREMAEEMRGRDTLRQRNIPQYFESELGKAFLLSQANDVDRMMIELSEDPRRDGSEAIRREPNSLAYLESPLQKQVVLYQPVYSEQSDRSSASDSPARSGNAKLPSETPVSYTAGLFNDTPSGLRPCNPTPAHAAGQGSPAPLRPKNPTPGHATKLMEKDRPVNPTPKLAGGKDASSAESEYQKNGYPLIPEQPTEEEPKSGGYLPLQAEGDLQNRSLLVNVIGIPRNEPVLLPTSIMGGKPGAIPNNRYKAVEEPVRRQLKNSLIGGATVKGQIQLNQMQGLIVMPEEVNFGVLREGSTYSVSVYLKNTGIDSCRFKIKQPPPATGLRVIYKPGPVPAGLATDLNLELYAIAVGVEGESGIGRINHELIIVTETDILRLPVTAILTAYDYDNRSPDSPIGGKSPGTKLVSTRPPATTGIIRPRKENMMGKVES